MYKLSQRRRLTEKEDSAQFNLRQSESMKEPLRNTFV